jgi:hypothetical protein
MSRPEGYNCTCRCNAKVMSTASACVRVYMCVLTDYYTNTMPFVLQEFTCVHSLGVALMRSILVPPVEAMVHLLGRRRKRGRLPQLPPAWEMMPFALYTPPHHPQQDSDILLGNQAPVPADQLEAGVNLANEFLI